jgi:hypothetical protein
MSHSINLPIIEREKARQAQCPLRRTQAGLGSCGDVSVRMGFPMGMSLDQCDKCYALGGWEGGTSFRDEYVKESVEKLKKRLPDLNPPTLAILIRKHMTPAEQRYAILSQALRLGDELALALAAEVDAACVEDVKQRLTGATEQEKWDALPASKRWGQVKQTWTEAEEVDPLTLGDFVGSILSGKRVDKETYEQRHISCHGTKSDGTYVQPPCPAREQSKVSGDYFCDDCGCGDWKLARLSTKLSYTKLACPRRRAGFSNATLTISANPKRHEAFFDRVVLINLKRRADRKEAFFRDFPKDWAFKEVTVFEAVDGDICPPPTSWRQGGGAWGCMQSHRRILEQAMHDGVKSLLVLEDDALFAPDFMKGANEFLDRVPKDWDQLMLGGQHINVYRDPPPVHVSGVVKCHNCQRTHAYAVSDRYMRELYRAWQGASVHCDWVMGPMQRGRRVYAPERMLVAQREGPSDINGRVQPRNFWNRPPEEMPVFALEDSPLPLDRLAGLRERGFHLGYDRDERTGVDKSLTKAFGKGIDAAKLKEWLNAVSWESHQHQDLYPCLYHPTITDHRRALEKLWGPRLKWVKSDGPPAKDILSG